MGDMNALRVWISDWTVGPPRDVYRQREQPLDSDRPRSLTGTSPAGWRASARLAWSERLGSSGSQTEGRVEGLRCR